MKYLYMTKDQTGSWVRDNTYSVINNYFIVSGLIEKEELFAIYKISKDLFSPDMNKIYKEIIAEKTEEFKNKLKTSELQYDILSNEEKLDLKFVAWKTFVVKENLFIFSFFICNKQPIKRIHKTINNQIFEIIEYIKRVGVKTKWLFRLEKGKDVATFLANKLYKGEKIEYTDIDINTLALIVIIYTKHINGIIPCEYINAIKNFDLKNQKFSKKIALMYLPFIFNEQERRLILKLFNLVKEINKYKEVNFMNEKGMLRMLTLALFPVEFFESVDDIIYSESLIEEIFNLDFNKLPLGYRRYNYNKRIN